MLIEPATLMKAMGREIPEVLVDKASFSRIREASRALPPALSSHYLECRLGKEAGPVDWLTCASTREAGDRVLASLTKSPGSLGAAAFHPDWEHLRRFFAIWGNPRSTLNAELPIVWMEFDMTVPKGAMPLPNIIVRLASGHPTSMGTKASKNLRNHPGLKATLKTLQVLGQGDLSSRATSVLTDCFSRLPSKASLLHLSYMLRRNPAALKLDIQLQTPDLEGFLGNISWPGSIPAIRDFFPGGEFLGGEAKFQLACGEDLHPLIEFEFDIYPEAGSLAKAEKLLKMLQVRKLCDARRAKALLAWPGESRLRIGGDGLEIRTRRWLDLKTSWHADRGWLAKAYLGFSPRFSFFGI